MKPSMWAVESTALVRLKSVVVIRVTSDGVLCSANSTRFRIPFPEIHRPPAGTLKSFDVVDILVSDRFAREHRLI